MLALQNDMEKIAVAMLTGHALYLLFDVGIVKCHCLDDTCLSH